MAAKTVSVTLPGGTKVTCSEEQAKRYADPAPKAPAKKAAPSKSSDEK